MRLGLLLSDIGQKNGVEVSQQEMNQLIMQAAQQYRPEQRQQFQDYIRGNAMAAAQLRAPLFEDKVVDFLFGKAEVSERPATREELEAAIEAEEGHVHGPGCGHDHDHDHADAPAAKAKVKAKAKKVSAKAAAKDDEPAADRASPKKAAAKPDAPAGEAAKPARKAAPKKAAPKKA